MGLPTQVACYSRIDADQFKYNENSSLRRFVQPKPGPINFHVNSRCRSKLAEIHRPKRIDQLMKACFGSAKGKKALLEADVIAPRSVIVKMMHGIGKFNVSFASGRLFIEEHEDEKKKLLQVTGTGFLAKYGFQYGCSFPYYYSPFAFRNPPNDLNDWNAVILRTIGGLNILMSGEVHCVKGKYTANPNCYLELHSRPIGSNSLPYLKKINWKDWKDWYLRMHLMGISELFVGLRDPEGNLAQTQLIQTDDIPDIIKSLGKDIHWDPQESIVRAFKVLYLLRDWTQEAVDMLEARPEKGRKKDDLVWRVEMRGKREDGAHVRELSREEKERLYSSKDHRSWQGDGQPPLPILKRYGIVERALVRELRQLDLGTLTTDVV